VAVTVLPKNNRESARAPSLDLLQSLIGDDLKRVNHVILDHMSSRVALIPELASHIIAAGGKRLRPMLTLASAKLCGYAGIRHIPLAASVEFIHTATLLHDDVVDGSDLRRGNSTANVVWGNPASVLVGDFLFSRAFQLMVEDGSIEVLRILANASAVIAEGEVHQLITVSDMATTEETYLEVIAAKTGALFAAACRIGAVVAERPVVEAEALERFGANLGMAFQLTDDALDYTAPGSHRGKNVGDDFRDGKITLPVVLAYQRGSETERRFWQRTLERMEQAPGDLEEARSLLDRHGTIRATVERARDYGAIAHEALRRFPEGPVQEALSEAVEYAIERTL
jgi:octaprenyl-diphosphate synthase